MGTKIFCIGFHETGTTSLAKALRTLGYRVTGPNGVADPDIAQNVVLDYFKDRPDDLLVLPLTEGG